MDVVYLCCASGKYPQSSGYPLAYISYPFHDRGIEAVLHAFADIEQRQLRCHGTLKPLGTFAVVCIDYWRSLGRNRTNWNKIQGTTRSLSKPGERAWASLAGLEHGG